MQGAMEIVLTNSRVVYGGQEAWEEAEPPWRADNQINISNWAMLQMCKQ